MGASGGTPTPKPALGTDMHLLILCPKSEGTTKPSLTTRQSQQREPESQKDHWQTAALAFHNFLCRSLPSPHCSELVLVGPPRGQRPALASLSECSSSAPALLLLGSPWLPPVGLSGAPRPDLACRALGASLLGQFKNGPSTAKGSVPQMLGPYEGGLLLLSHPVYGVSWVGHGARWDAGPGGLSARCSNALLSMGHICKHWNPNEQPSSSPPPPCMAPAWVTFLQYCSPHPFCLHRLLSSGSSKGRKGKSTQWLTMTAICFSRA